MSFDVFLQFAERDAPLDGATAFERLCGVVRAHGGGSRGEHGFFFETPEGIHIEMYAGEEGDGAMVALRGHALETMPFIFDIMKATGWTALAGDEGVATLKEIPVAERHEGFPDPTVVSSVQELTEVLLPDFQKWKSYRDQVVKGD